MFYVRITFILLSGIFLVPSSFFQQSTFAQQKNFSQQGSPQSEPSTYYYWNGTLDDLSIGSALEIDFPSWVTDKHFVSDPNTQVYYYFENSLRYTDNLRISLRTTNKNGCKIRLFLRTSRDEHPIERKFSFSKRDLKKSGEKNFLIAKAHYYQDLVSKYGSQGGFLEALKQKAAEDLYVKYQHTIRRSRETSTAWWSQGSILGFVSGNVALDENLALDRNFNPLSSNEKRNIPIEKLRSVTVAPIPWETLQKGVKPKLDPLSNSIPFDQHAFFFRSYEKFKSIRSSFTKGFNIYSAIFDPNEVEPVLNFYQKQLGIDFQQIDGSEARLWIKSVVVTGSDFHFLEGTDVAVLFECKDTQPLFEFFRKDSENRWTGASIKRAQGSIGTLEFQKTYNDDRSVCQFLAKHENVVILCNSEEQLRKIQLVLKNKRRSISEMEEYHYFRTQFSVDGPESVFLFLSDPTIRRWCNPKWRIGGDRRARVRNVMQSVVSRKMFQDLKVTKKFRVEKKEALIVPYSISEKSILSDEHGSLQFQTPIIEYNLRRVSKKEKDEYEAWLDRYQNNNWSNGFDPIGIRVHLHQSKEKGQHWNDVDLDILVMPLSDNSTYNMIYMIMSREKGPKIQLHLNPSQLAFFAIDRTAGFFGDFFSEITDDFESFSGQLNFSITDKDGSPYSFPEYFFRLDKSTIPIDKMVTDIKEGTKGDVYRGVPIMDESYYRTIFPLSKRELFETIDKERAKYLIDYSKRNNASKQSDPYGIQQWLDRRDSRSAFAFFPNRIPSREIKGDYASFILETLRAELMGSLEPKIAVLNEWRKLNPKSKGEMNHYKYFNRSLPHPVGGKFVWNPKLQTYESSTFGNLIHQHSLDIKKDMFPSIDAIFGSVDFPNNSLRASLRIRSKPKTMK